MIKLGIKTYGHDTGAALIEDGKIIVVGSEERFNRQKHSGQFPKESINFCLRVAGVDNINDIDEICTGFDYWKLIFYLYIRNFWKFLPFHFYIPVKNIYYHLRKIRTIYRVLRKEYGFKGKITFLDHHDCHAALVYYTSIFKEAGILTIDGRGEKACTRIYSANESGIKLMFQKDYPDSLGVLYTAVTEYLGFKGNCDEGKVMGLASYGNPTYVDDMRKVLSISDSDYHVNLSYLDFSRSPSVSVSAKFVSLFGPKRDKGDKITPKHEDIAKALQTLLDEAVIVLATKTKLLTGCDNLCLAGGVALNSVANGLLLQKGIFKDIFLYPASGDDGISVGASLYAYYKSNTKEYFEANSSPYKGYNTNDEEILEALKIYNLSYKKSENICKETASLLAENYCVGWYQGKAEIGPRALGNRSILIDPRNESNKDLVNSKIKFRESFRPFAPSILVEYSQDFFDLLEKESPYMLLAVNVFDKMRGVIPAVTHVDGTARVQTVSHKFNKKYWELINEFYNLTAVPVLLNTSFNRMGEPIVNTPEDAIKCFLGSKLDALVIEDYIVLK